MKKLLSLLVILSCFSGFASAATVQQGTSLSFSTTKDVVTSKHLKNNSSVEIVVLQDTYSNGVLVFQKGQKGIVKIADTLPARKMGKGGHIYLGDVLVPDVYGTQRILRSYSKIDGQRRNWVITVGAIGLETIVGAPLALFWLKKGYEATLPADKILNATTVSTFDL